MSGDEFQQQFNREKNDLGDDPLASLSLWSTAAQQQQLISQAQGSAPVTDLFGTFQGATMLQGRMQQHPSMDYSVSAPAAIPMAMLPDDTANFFSQSGLYPNPNAMLSGVPQFHGIDFPCMGPSLIGPQAPFPRDGFVFVTMPPAPFIPTPFASANHQPLQSRQDVSVPSQGLGSGYQVTYRLQDSWNEPELQPTPIAETAAFQGASMGPDPSSLVSPPKQQANCQREARAAARKKREGAPKRALSAYNLFFREERARMLEEITCGGEVGGHQQLGSDSDEQGRQPCAAAQQVKRGKRGGKKRPKPHGKVGFEEMAKTISIKWKQIDPETKKRFEILANTEKSRYQAEKEIYLKKQNEIWEESRQKLEASVDKETMQRYLASRGNSAAGRKGSESSHSTG